MGGNPNWVKGGPSPNPKGRPRKEKALSEILRRQLKKRNHALADGRIVSGNEAVARALVELALGNPKGTPPVPPDGPSLRYIFDRVDGKPDIFNHILDVDLPQIVFALPPDPDDPDESEGYGE